MTHAELEDRMRRYTPRAKASIAVFGVLMIAFQFFVLFAAKTGPQTHTAALLRVTALLLQLPIAIILFRRLVYFLAKQHDLVCPACRKNLLGNPAETVLVERGQCYFCGSQVVGNTPSR